MNRGLLALLILLVMGVGALLWLHDWRPQDLDSEGYFARVLVIKNGKGWIRTGEAGVPGASEESLNRQSASPLTEGSGVPPMSRIDVEPNSELRIETTGGWILLIKEGVYYLLDARRDEKAGSRWLKIQVERGSLRAKPQDYHAEEQRLDVEAGETRILAVESQFGMRVLGGGAGQAWLIEGDATLERSGRDSIKMIPKKVEDLQ